jgi:hypothetical protein
MNCEDKKRVDVSTRPRFPSMFSGEASTVSQFFALQKFPRPTRNHAIPDLPDGVSDSKKSRSSLGFRIQPPFVGVKTPTTTKSPDCNALVVLKTIANDRSGARGCVPGPVNGTTLPTSPERWHGERVISHQIFKERSRKYSIPLYISDAALTKISPAENRGKRL